MAIIKNAVKTMEATLSPERVARARKSAEKEIFCIRLSDLRKQMKVKQVDICSFTQSAISKLERRKDMKISTLVDYLENIGMGVEIKVYPRKKRVGSPKGITLLRS